MARYVVTVRTSMSVEESFAYMADLTNFARLDPGVISSTQVEGDHPFLARAFDGIGDRAARGLVEALDGSRVEFGR
ncbi:MAG: hypothetical protein ACR2QO_20505 [Acidimicrobiales bacterium]